MTIRIEHVALWARDLERMSQGVAIVGRPRVTGDGYYEAVITDPEGNSVELMA